MPFYPGPGLGGHCIPIDPFYLSWKAKQSGFDPRFIELAGQINGGDAALRRRQDRRRAEPRIASRSTARPCSSSALAYKRDIDDIRESPSLDVMALLHQKGAQGPLRRSVRADAGRRARGTAASTCTTEPLTPAALADADCVAILTDHRAVDYDMVLPGGASSSSTRATRSPASTRTCSSSARRRRRDPSRRPSRARRRWRNDAWLWSSGSRSASWRTFTPAIRCCCGLWAQRAPRTRIAEQMRALIRTIRDPHAAVRGVSIVIAARNEARAAPRTARQPAERSTTPPTAGRSSSSRTDRPTTRSTSLARYRPLVDARRTCRPAARRSR